MSFLDRLGSQKLLVWVTGFFAAISLVLTFACLNRAPGMSDECWYLLLHRDGVVQMGSAWNLIVGFLPNGIVAHRLFNFAIPLVATVAFAVFVSAYTGLRFPWRNLWVPFLALVAIQPPPLDVSYITLNLLFCSFAFLFLGVALQRRSMFWAIGSGVCLFFLIPVMITNFPLCALLVFLLVCLHESSLREKVSVLMGGVIGIIFGALVYFLVFQSPDEYLVAFASARKSSSGGVHSLYSLYLRTWDWLVILFTHVVLASIALFFCLRKEPESSPVLRSCRWIVGLALVGCSLACCVKDVLPLLDWFNYIGGAPGYPLWVVGATVVLLAWQRLSRPMMGVLLAVYGLPYALAWGSAAGFDRTGVYYWPLVLAAVSVCLPVLEESCHKIVRLLLVVIISFTACYSLREYIATWRLPIGHFISSTVKDDQTGYLLDARIKNDLDRVRPVIARQPVLITDRWAWGYAYLSGAKPIAYPFYFHEGVSQEAVENLPPGTEFFVLTEIGNVTAHNWLAKLGMKRPVELCLELTCYPRHQLYRVKP